MILVLGRKPATRVLALVVALCYDFALCGDRIQQLEHDKDEHFQPDLLDEPSQKCEDYIPVNADPVAVILSPSHGHVEFGPNITVICCVKNLENVPRGAAWLHVVDGVRGYPAKAENPIMLKSGATAIAWAEVPEGAYAAYIAVMDSSGSLLTRSQDIKFSKAAETATLGATASHAFARHPWQQSAEDRRGFPSTDTFDKSRTASGDVEEEEEEEGSSDVGEWPLLKQLRKIAAASSQQPAQPSREDGGEGEAACSREESADEGRAQHKWEVCGWDAWEEVSMHEVVASFLKAEWYKEEHAEWRTVPKVDQAVRHPNLQSDNENVPADTPRPVIDACLGAWSWWLVLVLVLV